MPKLPFNHPLSCNRTWASATDYRFCRHAPTGRDALKTSRLCSGRAGDERSTTGTCWRTVNCNVTLATTFTACFPVMDTGIAATKRIPRPMRWLKRARDPANINGLCGEVHQGSTRQLWRGLRRASAVHGAAGRGVGGVWGVWGKQQILRVQVEAELLPDGSLGEHTLHAGRATCHPRSCMKNASSRACQILFHSYPRAGTSERVLESETL